MTRFINADARDTALRRRFQTKAALKRAVAQTPDEVVLFPTALFTTDHETMADKVQPGEVWNVVGPDPYNDRRWYASVQLDSKGKVTVK